MSVEERITFCRICEPLCGLVATVEDGKVTKLRPDPDHPISRGFACPKGIAMTEIQNDPDRVTRPLRRRADGGFEPVSWEEALDDISGRLRAVIRESGGESIGFYMGNPVAFSYSHSLWLKGFLDGLGTPHYYSAGSQDTNSRLAASALLYGSPLVVPVPDLPRTNFLLIVGANPVVSHGSLISGTRMREEMKAIVARGGRVVVVDPRRTETAREFEHVPIRVDTDSWLLLAMLNVILSENRHDALALARLADGADRLRELAARVTPEQAAERTGVPADRIRALARDLADAEGAAVYGRTGACLGSFSTLVNFLLDALNAVTGNLDRPGGAIFPSPPVDIYDTAHKEGLDSYGKIRTRVGGFPDIVGMLPSGVMADEITTPGPGQLRALFVSAGNPVVSAPDGAELERALPQLDLLVSLDIYVNETNRHADYVLPTTTFLEREDLNLAMLAYQVRPFVQWTEPVVAPRGEARPEWEIIQDIADRIGIVPFSTKKIRRLGRLTRLLKPRVLADLMLRLGPGGDRFGLRRGGLNLRRVQRAEHGILLADTMPTGVIEKRIYHDDGRLHLAPEPIAGEVDRLLASAGEDDEYPLRLFGRRELRSHNSWMHNSPKLMSAGRRQTLRVHPDDASRLGLADGEIARLSSRTGSIEVPVEVTDEVVPGSVSLPHGWGHKGGWRRANEAGGANSNLLASAAHEDLEPLVGMTVLSGIPVKLAPVREPVPA